MQKYKSVIKNYIYNPEKFVLDEKFRDYKIKNVGLLSIKWKVITKTTKT